MSQGVSAWGHLHYIQCLHYLINYVVRHHDFFTTDFTHVIKELSVEDVFKSFKSVAVLEQFLMKRVLKLSLASREFVVADDVDHPVKVEILNLSKD